MARVTELPSNGAESPHPPPQGRRGAGRPRTKPNATDFAEEETPARSASEIDEDKETPYFELIKAYPLSEWGERLFAYLYRLGPTIDRGRTGSKHNVQRFSQPVDEETILKSSYGGSGDYQFILNRWDPHTRQTRMLRQHNFKLLNMDYPPRIPFGEWINADANKEWLWAKPKLEAIAKAEAEAAKQPAAALTLPPGADPTTIFNLVLSMVEKVLPKSSDKDEVIKTIRENYTQQLAEAKSKPGELLELVTTIVTAIRPPTGGGDAVTELLKNMREDSNALRAELAEERKFNREQIAKVLTNPGIAAAPPPSLKQQLEDLVSVRDLAGILAGKGTPREARTDWPDVLARVGEKLVEEMPAFLQVFAMGRAPARRPPATIETQPRAVEPGAEEIHEEENPTMAAIRQISNQFGPMFDEVTPELAKQFGRNIPGMSFRDWFITEYGNRTYDFMKKMDPQTIIDVIELRKREAPEAIAGQLRTLEPKAKLRTFIEEFLSDAAADDEEEEDAPPPTEPSKVLDQEF